MAKQKVICIVGPTASGKTALSIEIAKKMGGEIISADSRQVYRGLNIGTGKVSKREMRGIPHHLLDMVSPKTVFTAHDFKIRATSALSSIAARGNIPLICGGTGFYIDSLLDRVVLPEVGVNKILRRRLEQKTAPELFKLLQRKDPNRARTIDQHNKVRLIRALEIADALGASPMVKRAESPYDALWIGIAHTASHMRENINTRLKARLKSGMVAEAKRLRKNGLSYKRMTQLGLEYRSLARFLQGEISRSELEKELQSAIWHYAKRQMTYWKRNNEIRWFKTGATKRVQKEVENWLTK